MARLEGLQINDVVVEIRGPQEGRNYFADGTFSVAVTPEVEVQVFGSAVVKVQTNVNHIYVGERASNIGSQGAINTEKAADPATWVDLAFAGAAADPNIDASDGLQVNTAALPIGNPNPTFIRIVVVTPGSGWVHLKSKWR